jgi:hypothetical protein
MGDGSPTDSTHRVECEGWWAATFREASEVLVTPVVDTAERQALQARFEALAAEWKAETAFLSSSTAMVAHPASQAIIALGPPVVPLLLRDMEREHVHWFEALRAITGEDPVPRDCWGHIPAMTSAWLDWGRERGLI